MAVVVGNEEYDWQQLEMNCEYKNGYGSGDQTVSLRTNMSFLNKFISIHFVNKEI